MSKLDPVAIIKARLSRFSLTQSAMADELGVSTSYLGDVLQGRRPPSDRLLAAMGIERVYRKVRK